MNDTDDKYYEAGSAPPLGAYLCAHCKDQTAYILKQDEQLPVCGRCGNNYWIQKQQYFSFLAQILNLIQIREISKNKFLNDIGLNKSTFFDWERRGTIPSGDVLIKIADYFQISVDYLLGRDINSDSFGANLDEKILLDSYRSLNSEGQEIISNFIDTMMKSGKYSKKSDKYQMGQRQA